MGGKLIVSILDADIPLTTSFKRLVLQPNIDANLVRAWLSNHSFTIIDEKIVLDEGKFYEVIVAEPTDEETSYNELDLEFGPILRQTPNDEVFKARWMKEFNKNQEIMDQLAVNHPRLADLEARQALLSEVLKCQS